MSKIIVKSTSIHSAKCSEIILRHTKTTRLVFSPEIVDNPHNNDASVRGTFIFQRKSRNNEWQDYKSLSLSNLKVGEWIKLELKSEEVNKLMQGLSNLKKIYNLNGIPSGEREYVITSDNMKSILEQIANYEDIDLILLRLKDLKIDNLQKLNSLIGISRLRNAMDFWEINKNNGEEETWQKEFAVNSWLISQLFSYPVVLLREKAYIGGKSIDNTGGNIADFIYTNQLTRNVAIIEIKTPLTRLMASIYRGNPKKGVYTISAELSGAFIQLLNYKDKLQKDFYSIAEGSGRQYYSFNPKCILIIGSLKSEDFNAAQLNSFELFRSTSKDIDIITFDELYAKIKILVEYLEK